MLTLIVVRIPTNPPLTDPKDEMLLEPCEEEDAIVSLAIDNWLLH